MKLDPLGFKTCTSTFIQTESITVSHFPMVSYSLECPVSPHTNPSHLGDGAAVVERITSWTTNPGIA